MIKAESLRIGNHIKVTIGNDAGIYEVIAISGWQKIPKVNDEHYFERLVQIQGGARDNEFYPEIKLRGAKITEKHLKEFGFEHSTNSDDQNFYKKNNLDFELHLIGLEFADYPTTLKYIHELQNFYFALTGEELQLQ